VGSAVRRRGSRDKPCRALDQRPGERIAGVRHQLGVRDVAPGFAKAAQDGKEEVSAVLFDAIEAPFQVSDSDEKEASNS
jgi:hypothetical protein